MGICALSASGSVVFRGLRTASAGRGAGRSDRGGSSARPPAQRVGQPIAALVAIENADMETVALSTNRQFLDLIERSRARARTEGGISGEEMRRRFE